MKLIKQIVLTILILASVGILFRGGIFRSLVTYQSIGQRSTYPVTDYRLADYINLNSEKLVNPKVEQIIKLGLSITSDQLNFTASKNDNDPNKLITSRTAHCVGYAAFFAATCNYLLNKYDLSGNWNVTPQIGQMYFLRTNMHKYFNSPFFKDHDFVTLENKTTGVTLAVDPTVHDYLRITYITYK